MNLLAETQTQDLSGEAGVVDTANRTLAMILPPGVLKEFGTRTNLCTVDQFVNLTDEYSADPSIGIERDCSPYTPAVEAARQAVSSPKPYTPPLSN